MIKKPNTPVPHKSGKVKADPGKQKSSAEPKVLSPEVLPADLKKRSQRSASTPKSNLATRTSPEKTAEPLPDEDLSESEDSTENIEFEEPENLYSAENPYSMEDQYDSGSSIQASNPSDSSESHLPQFPTSLTHSETELTRSISPQDPLRRYMEELRHFPLLSSEEEYALAIRLRDQGDLQAAKSLVSANLRLVVKIAFEYRTIYSNVLDLIQEGNIGLMKAVSKYDPTKGARLGYYASWWIRSYILKYLLDNFRLVKVGTTQAQKKLFYHLMREKERLEAQGMLAGPKLLAEKLNVKEKEVIEMEQRLSGGGAEMSLDAPIDSADGSSASHMDFLADPQESADRTLEREQLLQILRDQLPQFQKLLNEKELRILQDRLLAEAPKTLQEVADLYGLTRERARQIEAKVIEKLRELLKGAL